MLMDPVLNSNVDFLNNNAFALTSGTMLSNRYVIKNVIGVGGFSVIYEGYDRALSATVAIKEYFPQDIAQRIPGQAAVLTRNAEEKRRFEKGLVSFKSEAEKMVELKGRNNTLDVFGLVEENNTCYIIMEYLEGKTLLEYIKTLPGGRFSDVDDAKQIIFSVSQALGYLHSKKIIHRDVAPDNIFLCNDGRVKLIDLGAARDISPAQERELSVVVKNGCTPPEQYRKNGKQGTYTDIYALGATFYMMLTGVYPDSAPDRIGHEEAYVAPSTINPAVPEYIDTLIERCLAYDYTLRLRHASEIESVLKRQTTIATVKSTRKRKNILVGAIYSLAFLCLALFAVIGFTVYSKMEPKHVKGDIKVLLPEGFSRESGIEAMVENFTENYPNVTVEIKSAEDRESCDIVPSNDTVVAYDLEILYINTIKAGGAGKTVSELNESNIAESEYAQSYEEFVSEENGSFAYKGSVSEYRKVQKDLAPAYKLILLSGKTPIGLGISDGIEKKNRTAAKRFLEYLCSDRAQELLFINNSGLIPANGKQSEIFFGTYPELTPEQSDERKVN